MWCKTIPEAYRVTFFAFSISRWIMWTLQTSSEKRLCCFCWISLKEISLTFWLSRRKMVSDDSTSCSVCSLNRTTLQTCWLTTRFSVSFFDFSVPEDSGIGRRRLLLHSDTLWIWKRISVWTELQQGGGFPRSGHALQRQTGILARHSHWQEPPGSGKRHHPQQEQVGYLVTPFHTCTASSGSQWVNVRWKI